MSDGNIPIKIPCDNDGYVTFQCPFCNEVFKLSADEVQADDVINLFCPICGLMSEPNSFLSDKVIKHVQDIAMNYFKNLLNDSFKKMERNSKGFFKVTNKLKIEQEKLLYETENELQQVTFECCEKSAKIRLLNKELGAYCPYCGVK
jgi:transcription elongation factor Elf1